MEKASEGEILEGRGTIVDINDLSAINQTALRHPIREWQRTSGPDRLEDSRFRQLNYPPLVSNSTTARPKSVAEMLAPLKASKIAWILSLFYFLTFGGFVALALYTPTFLREIFELTPLHRDVWPIFRRRRQLICSESRGDRTVSGVKTIADKFLFY